MSKKGMENVVLTAQNHRNAWSFTATVKYIQIALQMTHHFYLEILHVLMYLQIVCLSFLVQTGLWVSAGTAVC